MQLVSGSQKKAIDQLFIKKEAIRAAVIYSPVSGACEYQMHSFTISLSSLTQPWQKETLNSGEEEMDWVAYLWLAEG